MFDICKRSYEDKRMDIIQRRMAEMSPRYARKYARDLSQDDLNTCLKYLHVLSKMELKRINNNLWDDRIDGRIESSREGIREFLLRFPYAQSRKRR